MINTDERPNTLPWPPMLYAGLIIVAMVLNRAAPLPIASEPAPGWLFTVGTMLFVTGFALDIGTLLLFARRKANFLPHRAATQLITDGTFRLSRNPIYLGNTLALLGAGIAFNSLWLILAALLAAILVHHLAIVREERHLAAKFGAEWQAYAKRTPRWLFF